MAQLGKAALAIAAAVQATGAHRYRHRTWTWKTGQIPVHEVYRANEHAFFVSVAGGPPVLVKPGVPVRLSFERFDVRVVPSK